MGVYKAKAQQWGFVGWVHLSFERNFLHLIVIKGIV
jgi:hypothetical protein